MAWSRSVIDKVASGLKTVLKSDGFGKSGRTYSKITDDGGLVIHVQASRENDETLARFTLNLGVRYEKLQELMNWPRTPKHLSLQDCVIQTRIGPLMEVGRDFWWLVEPAMDLQSVIGEVGEALHDFGLPFLRDHSVLRQARSHFLETEGPYRCFFLHVLEGDEPAAQAAFNAFASSENVEYLLPRARAAAAKAGIVVRGLAAV